VNEFVISEKEKSSEKRLWKIDKIKMWIESRKCGVG
jgi:hypothetical protein